MHVVIDDIAILRRIEKWLIYLTREKYVICFFNLERPDLIKQPSELSSVSRILLLQYLLVWSRVRLELFIRRFTHIGMLARAQVNVQCLPQ